MNIYTWHVIRFKDAYALCKWAIKNYDVDFWDMWDMLISQCEMPNEDLVRIDFIEDGFLRFTLIVQPQSKDINSGVSQLQWHQRRYGTPKSKLILLFDIC